MPVETVKNLDDIEELRQRVRNAAVRTRLELATILADLMEAVHTLKFCAYGFDPLVEAKRLNLIEQLNQTFTNMATLAAAQRLLKRFPECREHGLRLRLGTSRGRDIESIDSNLVEAEVFAAVRPSNNGKLTKDINRLAGSTADNRFVFFHCPSQCDNPGQQHSLEREDPVVQVWALGKEEVM